MFPIYRSMVNFQAMKSLTKRPEMPKVNLAIAGDDEMANVPLLIFNYQHGPIPVPQFDDVYSMPYEKTAVKGANDTLSLDNFPTNDFNLGAPYDSI